MDIYCGESTIKGEIAKTEGAGLDQPRNKKASPMEHKIHKKFI